MLMLVCFLGSLQYLVYQDTDLDLVQFQPQRGARACMCNQERDFTIRMGPGEALVCQDHTVVIWVHIHTYTHLISQSQSTRERRNRKPQEGWHGRETEDVVKRCEDCRSQCACADAGSQLDLFGPLF